jgi:BirA family biotin operon repressor/biotin-[acetyl-CoA-carboxylase] ligase
MTAVPTFTILDSVDSTNNYAMGMIRDGVAKSGDAWFSYEQTHGKGRRGKVWKAEKAMNIIMSIAVPTAFLTVLQQFQLSVAASLASFTVFEKCAGDETRIKWPNDIFWNDRKAGGILIENVIAGNKWQWAVIGTGINVNQTTFNLEREFPAVSLKQITGKDFDIVGLAKEIHKAFLENYQALQQNDFGKMLVSYNKHLYGLGQQVKLKKGVVVFETTIEGVSAEGKLITRDVVEREFDFDEVKFVAKS